MSRSDATAKPELLYPEATTFKSTRPAGSGDLDQKQTGHTYSGFALTCCLRLKIYPFHQHEGPRPLRNAGITPSEKSSLRFPHPASAPENPPSLRTPAPSPAATGNGESHPGRSALQTPPSASAALRPVAPFRQRARCDRRRRE